MVWESPFSSGRVEDFPKSTHIFANFEIAGLVFGKKVVYLIVITSSKGAETNEGFGVFFRS